MEVFYKIWKKHHQIQLTKYKMNLEQSKNVKSSTLPRSDEKSAYGNVYSGKKKINLLTNLTVALLYRTPGSLLPEVVKKIT